MTVRPNYEELKRDTLRYWEGMLHALFRWSPERVRAWADQYREELEGRGNTWFYHDTAAYYIVPLVVPDTLWPKVASAGELRMKITGRELVDLKHELEAAMSHHRVGIEQFDFEAAKRRVEKVLQKYGESIPDRR